MAIKCTNTFHSKDLNNLPKIGIFGFKIYVCAIWQPFFGGISGSGTKVKTQTVSGTCTYIVLYFLRMNRQSLNEIT
jgi:hypothetical protein